MQLGTVRTFGQTEGKREGKHLGGNEIRPGENNRKISACFHMWSHCGSWDKGCPRGLPGTRNRPRQAQERREPRGQPDASPEASPEASPMPAQRPAQRPARCQPRGQPRGQPYRRERPARCQAWALGQCATDSISATYVRQVHALQVVRTKSKAKCGQMDKMWPVWVPFKGPSGPIWGVPAG
jgi:hypothetical protein